MKKLFTTLAMVASLSFGAFAQHCIGTDSTNITPHSASAPGLSPSADSLPCIVTGTYVSDTIYFKNFTSFSGLPLNSLTIDSIANLPAGTCWVTSHANNTFGPGENGVIYVSGNCTAAPGQYSLQIYIAANLTGLTVPPYTYANALAGLYYSVRVINSPYCPCPPIDTFGQKDTLFIPNNSCTVGVGINEVAHDLTNVSVVPNPFTTSANVTFTSDLEGTYTVKMMNLLGAVVSSKEINIVRGSNETTIERNGLSSGIYILSLSNGSASISRKVIIE